MTTFSKVGVLLVALLAACGGESEMAGPGMFDNSRLIISGQRDVPAGQKVQLFKVIVPDADSEQLVLTLVPPHKSTTTDPKLNGYDIVPLANVYAIVQWGNGQVADAQAEIDFGQGLSLPMRGSTIIVNAKNDGTVLAPNVGAFLSRGNFANGQPRRTIVATTGGVPISPGNATNATDEMRIPPYARSVQAQVILNGTTDYAISFRDNNGTQIMASAYTDAQAHSVEVPADAKTMSASTGVALGFLGVRFVFDLGL